MFFFRLRAPSAQTQSQNTKCFVVTECGSGRDRVTCCVTEHHSLCGQHWAVATVPASRHMPVLFVLLSYSHLWHSGRFDVVNFALFSCRVEQGQVTGVAAVCETPEKNLNPSTRLAQKADDQLVVGNTTSSSCSDVRRTDSQRKKPESKSSGAALLRHVLNIRLCLQLRKDVFFYWNKSWTHGKLFRKMEEKKPWYFNSSQ